MAERTQHPAQEQPEQEQPEEEQPAQQPAAYAPVAFAPVPFPAYRNIQRPPPPRAPQEPPRIPHPDPLVTAELGDLQYCPVARLILKETDEDLNQLQLHNLAYMLSTYPLTQVCFQALANVLYGRFFWW